MGSRKNSCKCVTVINFRGLTPWIHGARHAANAISYSWSLEIFLILLRKIHDFKGFESTRDSFWRSGPLFRRFLRFMWFGGHLRGKNYLFLTSKCDQKSIFFTRIFSMFLECSVLEIFGDFLHLRAHFGSHFNDFLWEMGFRKNSWKCVTVINFRGLTPCQMEFFTSPSDGYAFRMIFSPVSAILGHLRLPFRRLLAWILRKKRVWKIMPKSIQKRASNECNSFCPGGGALKNQRNQAFSQPDGRIEHAPGVPSGTVADISIIGNI